jgi:hypothetical protein
VGYGEGAPARGGGLCSARGGLSERAGTARGPPFPRDPGIIHGLLSWELPGMLGVGPTRGKVAFLIHGVGRREEQWWERRGA